MQLFLYYTLLHIFCLGIHSRCFAGRSIFRPLDHKKPEIVTRWVDSNQTYHLKSYYLEEQALFNKFDREYFMSHLLPTEEIPYRNKKPKKATNNSEETEPEVKKKNKEGVKGIVLHRLAEELIRELYNKKTKFKHFDVLKSQDFNYRTLSGLLILKYKKYPFVLKLFIETPESFVKPFSKGWQPGCFFVMGGGINRYLSGFIRIKNLDAIREQIKRDSEWREKLDTPRKWFWLSKQSRWFELASKNIGKGTALKLILPSIYGIFADAIDTDKQFNLLNRAHRESALKLSHFLGNRIDPHITNFIKEKDSDKILLIDTEHFPTMVGLRKPLQFTTYSSWYAQLTAKFLKDAFGRTKRFRQKLQNNTEKIISVNAN